MILGIFYAGIGSEVMLHNRFSLISSHHQIGDVILLELRQENIGEDTGIADALDARGETEGIVMLLRKRQSLSDDGLDILLVKRKIDG